jgi:putative transposase
MSRRTVPDELLSVTLSNDHGNVRLAAAARAWQPARHDDVFEPVSWLPLAARGPPTCRWLDHCFSLSLRDLELIVAARGIVVSYESIRDWGVSNHFQLRSHHLSANQHRTVRDAAFRTWREVAEVAPVASAITRPPLGNLTTPFLALCCLPLTTRTRTSGCQARAIACAHSAGKGWRTNDATYLRPTACLLPVLLSDDLGLSHFKGSS